MMRDADYRIYPAEGAGDHDGGGVLPWQHSRGRVLESLAWGSRGGGGTPGRVKLESKLSHTLGRGTPSFRSPLRFSASPDTLGSWSFPDKSDFFNLEPEKKEREREKWGCRLVVALVSRS